MKNEAKLPKATMEQVERVDYLRAELDRLRDKNYYELEEKISELEVEYYYPSPHYSTKELDERLDYLRAELDRLKDKNYYELEDKILKLSEENTYLSEHYNWFDVVFEENGKKGLKNVKGVVVVPAIYDGFTLYVSYLSNSIQTGAIRDGKVALVKRDGKGTPITDFEFDSLDYIPSMGIYTVTKSDDPKHFALMTSKGIVITPYELDKYWEGFNGILPLGANGKLGLLAVEYGVNGYVKPEYDTIEFNDLGSPVIFSKDGKKGYVTIDKHFITIEDYDNLEDPDEVELICTED